MKRVLSLLLSLALMLSLVPYAQAATPEAVKAANTLYEYGLFNGTGMDANGRPIFDLDRAPTRNEAVTMLVRLLGKENEAQQGSWTIPFTDVATWAKPYVGYAYANGLANGTSLTTFSGDTPVSVSQYITFVLRALGYSSGTDFQWDRAWELSDQIGLTDRRYNADTKTFTRGDAAIISNNALNVYVVDSGKKLGEILGISEPDAKPDTPVATQTGLDTLINYIKSNGVATDSGMIPVGTSYPLENAGNIDLAIAYVPSREGHPEGLVAFLCSFDSHSQETRLSMKTYFNYDIATKQAEGNRVLISCKLTDQDLEVFNASSFSFDIASYTNTTMLSFDREYFETNYPFVTYDDFAETFNLSVQLAMISWERFLVTEVGISLRDIGFTSYTY